MQYDFLDNTIKKLYKVSPGNKKLICIISNTKQTSILYSFNKLKKLADANTIIINKKYLLQNYNIKNIDSYTLGLKKLNLEYKTVIIFLTEKHLQQVRGILFIIDKLYIIAKAGGQPYFSFYLKQLLQQKKPFEKGLILLWKNKEVIKDTKNWLSNNNFIHYYHIYDTDKDYQRLLRYLKNKAIGVVLGGGLSLGWAHIGFLKAITERSIPIDLICGTSSGAGMAAIYLISATTNEQIDIANKISAAIKKSINVFSLNLPIVSLFDAKEVTEVLKNIFGDKCIEDLPIPYLAVSCNLSKPQEEIHNIGLLWYAVRSSGSILGAFPPITTKDGDLLVDGSIINNLPVDIIKKKFGRTTLVIANDINLINSDKKHYNIPASLTTGQIIFASLFNKSQFTLPVFYKIIIKAMMLGSKIKQNKNKKIADILVTPNLSGFAFLEFHQSEIKRIINAGYAAAKSVLQRADNRK
jgi:predicted acylesterase/phospholipase RssA